jgi:hypothetical protein
LEADRPPQQSKLSIVWGLSYKDYSWIDIERRRWVETREQLVNRGVSSKSSKSLLNSSARRDDAWSHLLAQSYRFPTSCSSLLSNYRSWPPCQVRFIFQIIQCFLLWSEDLDIAEWHSFCTVPQKLFGS